MRKFRASPEQRILALHGSDRLDGMPMREIAALIYGKPTTPSATKLSKDMERAEELADRDYRHPLRLKPL